MRNDSAVAALAGTALADSIPVTLRQMNIIKRLPDVPWRGFDANKVTTSPEAYPFGIPDGIPACALYATQLALVVARRRAELRPRRKRWVDRALAACIGAGAIATTYYGYQMIAVEKKACVYCITAMVANYAMVPFGWRILRGSR
jgi:uncharacterized membrane protein